MKKADCLPEGGEEEEEEEEEEDGRRGDKGRARVRDKLEKGEGGERMEGEERDCWVVTGWYKRK